MAVGFAVTDYDQLLERTNGNYVVLNDLNPDVDHELIKRLTVTTYNESTFSLIPSCSCGETTLISHPHLNIGDICEYCHTEMMVHSSRRLSPVMWIRPPDGIPAFIAPSFLYMLIAAFKVSNANKANIIHWLLDPYEKTFKDQKQIEWLLNHDVERGVTYFIENTEKVLQLLSDSITYPKAYAVVGQILYFYRQHKEKLFPKMLPLVDKSFNVIENTQLGSYLDNKLFTPMFQVVNRVIGIKRFAKPPAAKKKESICANILFDLVKYYTEYIKSNLNEKEGEFRKEVYGSKLPWTARMVIGHLHEPHDFDELHMPWSASIGIMEVHLTNLMLKDGYTPNQIKKKLLNAISNYDPDIDAYFHKLIEGSPHRTTLSNKPGIMFLDNRNPSLKMGSIQSCLVTKVKTDPTDVSSSMSILVVGPMNADFDGDALNKKMVLDMREACSLINLSVVNSLLSNAEPYKFSGDIGLPKQMIMRIDHWLSEGREDD